MRIDGADAFHLRIPFRLSITHAAREGRTFSDSIVIALGDGRVFGYGETVIREYVSGGAAPGAAREEEAAAQARRLLSPLAGREIGWEEAAEALGAADCGPSELPVLCAVETAVMDLACRVSGKDIFALLGVPPVREEVAYGGAIPMVPPQAVGKFVEMYTGFGFPNLKVKVGNDEGYNALVLGAVRSRTAPGFDVRVDANSSWDPADAERHLETCARFAVSLIEEPFPPSAAADGFQRRAREAGFGFVADEGFRTPADVSRIAASGACTMLNLRLAKNGGLRRVLALAGEAAAAGLSCQLGCMVGETGILSALGRAAAAVLPNPAYAEGSYDDVLLAENVTTESLGFGPRGRAPVVRGRGIGCAVDPERLARLSATRTRIL
jgi:L-Ala-D/L-Glu epimerase